MVYLHKITDKCLRFNIMVMNKNTRPTDNVGILNQKLKRAKLTAPVKINFSFLLQLARPLFIKIILATKLVKNMPITKIAIF